MLVPLRSFICGGKHASSNMFSDVLCLGCSCATFKWCKTWSIALSARTGCDQWNPFWERQNCMSMLCLLYPILRMASNLAFCPSRMCVMLGSKLCWRKPVCVFHSFEMWREESYHRCTEKVHTRTLSELSLHPPCRQTDYSILVLRHNTTRPPITSHYYQSDSYHYVT